MRDRLQNLLILENLTVALDTLRSRKARRMPSPDHPIWKARKPSPRMRPAAAILRTWRARI